MNITQTTAILVLSLFIVACSGSRTITTPATDRTLTIDGNLSGWDLQHSLIERTDAVSYYATHDNEFLYLYIDVRSPARNNAIRQSGLIIYLSSDEGNRKQVGLAFPSGTFNLLRKTPGLTTLF